MSLTVRSTLLALAMNMATMAVAGEDKLAVQAEITTLLSRLEASGCRFNRNGTWYPAAEAKSHLLTKLRYIEDRTTLTNTEQFIELAGTKSSFSGKPYLVQCGNASAQPSATWLAMQLQQMRTAPKR